VAYSTWLVGPAGWKIWERKVLYCVPLPGESAWVRRLDGAGAGPGAGGVVGAPPHTPIRGSETGVKWRDVRWRL